MTGTRTSNIVRMRLSLICAFLCILPLFSDQLLLATNHVGFVPSRLTFLQLAIQENRGLVTQFQREKFQIKTYWDHISIPWSGHLGDDECYAQFLLGSCSLLQLWGKIEGIVLYLNCQGWGSTLQT